ncbi:hypothetical protein [Aeromicrobium duanguangcaii]|uniref:hypothetical protein n=1 Tax=Aeromicrobium duanguangcaii TaxID=2968086 RepID=UPI002016FB37|nr:hypothetical protein [Aeromicrobium duanguangcaii]MCL3836895.1 hypothetical protein [Aeromicrobium duanguangcaii]
MDRANVERFIRLEDWSILTLGELRRALRDLTLLTLVEPVSAETRAYWDGRCDEKIDALLSWMMTSSDPRCVDDPTLSTAEVLDRWSQLTLTPISKARLKHVYMRAYFFGFMAAVELPHLARWVTRSGVQLEVCIDAYITTLVYNEYESVVIERLVTYESIPDISLQRVVQLKDIRNQMLSAIDRMDRDGFATAVADLGRPELRVLSGDPRLGPVIESVFVLMTYFVGTDYRRVHDAVTSIVSTQMADFRQEFVADIPDFIDLRGSVEPVIMY